MHSDSNVFLAKNGICQQWVMPNALPLEVSHQEYSMHYNKDYIDFLKHYFYCTSILKWYFKTFAQV